jgi:hypothetical protein
MRFGGGPGGDGRSRSAGGRGPQPVQVVHHQEARRQLPGRAGPRRPDGPGLRSADRRADGVEPPGTRDRHLVPGGHRVRGDERPSLAAHSRASPPPGSPRSPNSPTSGRSCGTSGGSCGSPPRSAPTAFSSKKPTWTLSWNGSASCPGSRWPSARTPRRSRPGTPRPWPARQPATARLARQLPLVSTAGSQERLLRWAATRSRVPQVGEQ